MGGELARLWGLALAMVIVAAGSSEASALAPKHAEINPGPGETADTAIAKLDVDVVRRVDWDICYPADPREYVALGKNAVLMLTSSSLASELPLKSVYLEIGARRVPLQKIATFDKSSVRGSGAGAKALTRQISFYLAPLSLIKAATALKADFKRDRSGFSIVHFDVGRGFPNAPDFVRLDRHDAPSKANVAALRALLTREYPDQFKH